MNPTNSQNLKSLKITYSALLLGVTFFLIIVVFLNQQAGPFAEQDPFFEQMLLGISNLMALTSIPLGLFLFKKRTAGIAGLSLPQKLDTYRSAMIFRAAVMEGSAFFFVICYALTGLSVFLIEILAVLALMVYFFPGSHRLSEELKHDIRKL
jgi:hypothetical protein